MDDENNWLLLCLQPCGFCLSCVLGAAGRARLTNECLWAPLSHTQSSTFPSALKFWVAGPRGSTSSKGWPLAGGAWPMENIGVILKIKRKDNPHGLSFPFLSPVTFLLRPRLPFNRPTRAPVSAWWRGASGWVSLPPWRVCSLRLQIGACVRVCVCVRAYTFGCAVPGCVGFSLVCPAGLLPSRSAPASRCSGSAGGHRPWGCGLQRLRLNSCAWAWLPPGRWDLPRPGITPTCPALAGRWHH